MNFKPADDYSSLKKQAYALYSLVKSMEDELSHYRSRNDELKESNLSNLKLSLESEKQMNAEITEENIFLQSKLDELIKSNKVLLTEFDQYSQDNKDYMGSPFRERVLNAISV